ncbi:UNVERIFIED_CONTAM: rhodanese-related sulfurtransferase [Brevibacillus sp. OAP136]
MGEIRERLCDLPKNQTVFVSCQVGLRGYQAARILAENGFAVKNLDGGYKTYAAAVREKELLAKAD